ncbi:hypothetical protein WJX72_003709 [[Myrmecia] bisecta]|uniref:[histone H3]-lysine(4) N-trimethyltransferase n=1 Tax=[Myrmecia] bisecta TaxID=41462 RepID=A0AAW1PCZ4_9CHLO
MLPSAAVPADPAGGLARASKDTQRSSRTKVRAIVRDEAVTEASKWGQLKGRAKDLCFKKSSVHAWGLFAKTSIEPEEFIIEYVGEWIRASITNAREAAYERCGLGSSYLFRVDTEGVVDATQRGGLARFINHSCDPNCYTKIITVEGHKHIGIYAKRLIQPGEELAYDYKFDLEDDEDAIPCLCGAKNCRGRLN